VIDEVIAMSEVESNLNEHEWWRNMKHQTWNRYTDWRLD
jgi:hypothetical protein